MKKTSTNFHSHLSALFSTPLIPRRRGRFCLLLLCFLPFGAFAQVSVWDGTHTTWTNGVGTEANPYLIENAAQLAHLAYYVNSGTNAVNRVVGSGKYWKLTTNIDLNGLEWTPIGRYTSYNDYFEFGGHFDGGGHTIANMVVNANRAGLFGGKNGGSVKDIGIIGNSSIKGIYNAGGIAGTAGGTIIVNCYNTGNVFSTTDYAGGIVGSAGGTIKNCYNTGSVSSYYAGGIAGTANGTIIDCYNTGSVSSTSSDQTSDHCAGGIVGKDAHTTITNCHNTGNVSATTNSNKYANAGGIVGQNASSTTTTIINCYNIGKISATKNGKYEANAGGMVGLFNEGTIKNCYNKGEISAYVQSESMANAGGMVGSYLWYSGRGTIENCYNTGTVSASTSTSNSSDMPCAGGIAGINWFAEVHIDNCYNTGNISALVYAGGIIGYTLASITSIDNCYNTGTISATELAGGIATWCEDTEINNCYNTGTISATNLAGGIVTWCDDTEINNCYNTGNISGAGAAGIAVSGSDASFNNCYNTGTISAATYAGGIAAEGGLSFNNCYNTGNISASAAGTTYISGIVASARSGGASFNNCYNTGTISASADITYAGGIVGHGYSDLFVGNCYNTGNLSVSATTYAGGIAGYYLIGSIINSYYLAGSAPNPGGGISQTATFMKTQDFVDLLNNGPTPNSAYKLDNLLINAGYPILKWQKDNTIATLSTLTVSEGVLSPAFSSNIYYYSVEVANSVTELTISATATDADATVTGAGVKQIAVGDNLFTITVTAADGVTKRDYWVTVNRAGVGIVETQCIASLRVYPNPTTGVLNLIQEHVTRDALHVTNVEVFDIYGKKQSNASRVTCNENIINISNLAAGIYFLKVGNEIVKVVKQ